MAGYKAANGEFVNATLINTQADRQREKFKLSNGEKGAADLETLNKMFQHKDNLVGEAAQAQFDTIVNNFKDLDGAFQDDPGANPDFPQGVEMDYRSGMSSPNLDALSDNPNNLGPNIHVPNENTFDPTQQRQRVDVPERSSDGGYGFKIDRNTRSTDPADADRIGTYFKRFYNEEAAPTKGEFVDSDDVSY